MLNYCGFTTVKELIKDHKGLKKDIKKREKKCNRLVSILNQYIGIESNLPSPQAIAEEVKQMSHEMRAINM